MKELSTIKGAVQSAIPKDISPMLATPSTKPKSSKGYIYEIKWDGFRAISYLDNGKINIKSRNNKPFNEKFYPIFEGLKSFNLNAVLDGEIAVLNDKGLPDFSALQTWRSESDGHLVYIIFDLLWLEGYDLMKAPLSERRGLLQKVLPENNIIKMSETFDASPDELIELAGKMKLEGVMAKKEDSMYQPGQRPKDWLKIKSEKHQEVIIGGYTRNEGSKRKVSALLTGIYKNGKLEYVTSVGTGFTKKMEEEIIERLAPIKTNNCPFLKEPEYNKPTRFRPNPPKAEVTWVKPEVVAEVSYRTVSSDGSLRHPSFRGIREDKSPKEVTLENIEEVKLNPESPLAESGILPNPVNQERKSLVNPSEETQVKNVEGKDLKFSNLSKIFWREEDLRKRDLINYYYQIAPYILPYLKGRPETLNRFPNGINGKSFYQKNVKGKVPDWADTYSYYSEKDQREKEFFVCSNEASLMYLANLGCIEVHPWSSKCNSPDNPDWCIIDLDPDKNSFEQVIEAACVTKRVLDEIEVPAFPKTSGSTGLHIYIPLGAKYSYHESKEFGRALMKVVQATIPDYTTIERYTKNRQGKMYLDFLQNRPQATVAAPYSLRPKKGAMVSMPLHWEEVKPGLRNENFTIFNAVERVREQGDLFSGVLGEGIDMPRAIKRLESNFEVEVLI